MSNNISPKNPAARKLSPLRQRMLDDMTVRNLSAQTQASYVQYVSQLARYFHTSPEKLGVEDIRTFLLYLANEKGLSPSTGNAASEPPRTATFWRKSVKSREREGSALASRKASFLIDPPP